MVSFLIGLSTVEDERAARQTHVSRFWSRPDDLQGDGQPLWSEAVLSICARPLCDIVNFGHALRVIHRISFGQLVCGKRYCKYRA
jgi:hypothetical protein